MRTIDCPTCAGRGETSCPTCNGVGTCCDDCDGAGLEVCPDCDGERAIEVPSNQDDLDELGIPASADDLLYPDDLAPPVRAPGGHDEGERPT